MSDSNTNPIYGLPVGSVPIPQIKVEQEYDPTDTNPLSGIAVAQAIAEVDKVYLGSGEMPEGYNIQIDPNSDEVFEYVKTTDYATTTKAGVVKNGGGVMGIQINASGIPYIEPASNTDIDQKSSHRKPIVPDNLEYAVKSIAYDKAEIDTKIGDIETALDSIIEIQNSLIGGNA